MSEKKRFRAIEDIRRSFQKRKLLRREEETVLMAMLVANMHLNGWEREEFLELLADTWDLADSRWSPPKLRVVK